MYVQILMDNNARDGLLKEWGLSVLIQYNGHEILLDAGTTAGFAQNAARMGVDLSQVELAVLSHAHYDHANGLEAFLELNQRAKVYLRSAAGEGYYGKRGVFPHYIGIRRGLMRKNPERFVRVDGKLELLPGAWLIPHSTPGLQAIGARAKLYVRRGWRLEPDAFAHEQSLVFELPDGLAVFNSCSHAGLDNILREVGESFPGRPIRAMVGGLHLCCLTDGEVRALAGRVRGMQVDRIYTGHCTGQRGYEVLREELGARVQQIYAGMEMEL